MLELLDHLHQALGEAYAIERELGGGGMARVFLARDRRLGRRIVIKVLDPEFAGGVQVERFVREMHCIAQLQHPHIVPLLAAGDANGTPYFTMPFVEGESVRARLARHGEMDVDEARVILRDVADALDYAHRRGVVHRDIKPDNVLLSEGRAALADFGLAKAVGAASRAGSLTMSGMVVGTPTYMAPEQMVGDPTDCRADIYAFGALGYEMLAGRPPFEGSSLQAILAAQLSREPLAPARLRQGVPAALSAMIMRCLARDPEQRPGSAADLRRCLDLISAHSTRWPAATVRWILAGAVALLVSVGALLIKGATPRRSEVTTPQVLVVPFESDVRTAGLGSMGAVTANWIARGLTQVGIVEVVSVPANDVSRFDSLAAAGQIAGKLPRYASLAGASEIIVGRVSERRDSVVFEARVLRAASSNEVGSFGPIAVSRDAAMRGADLLKQRIMGSFAMRFNDLGSPTAIETPPTYAAYRAFLDGNRAIEGHSYDYGESLRQFRRAYQLDTTFLPALVRATTAAYYGATCAVVDSLAVFLEARADRLSPYDEQFVQRVMAWCRGDWDAAFQAARRMTELEPHASEARFLAGRSALYLQRPRTALSFLLTLDPEHGSLRGDAEYYRDVGIAYHQLGQFDKELTTLRAGVSRWPEDPAYPYYLVRPLAALHRSAELDSVVNQASMSVYGPLAYVTAVGELQRHGDSADAEAMAHRFRSWADGIVQTAEDSAAGRLVLPYSQLLSGETVAAKRSYELLASRFPTQWRYLALAGVCAARAKEPVRARQFAARLRQLAVPYQRGENIYGAAQIEAALGDKEGAVHLLQQAISAGVPFYYAPSRAFPNPARVNDADPLLHILDGYQAFEALLAPKG